MNLRPALTVLLLVAVLATGWSLLRDEDPAPEAAAAVERSGYVLREFELVTLNSEGSESFSLRAPELRQTPGGRTMELTTPLFLMPDQHGSHWEIRSRTGWVSEDSSEIRLREDVVATSPQGSTRPTTLRTEQLDVFPNANLAVSDDAVTVTTPGSTMHGTGMQAHLADKRVELLSNVDMTYEPNRR